MFVLQIVKSRLVNKPSIKNEIKNQGEETSPLQDFGSSKKLRISELIAGALKLQVTVMRGQIACFINTTLLSASLISVDVSAHITRPHKPTVMKYTTI